MSRVVSLVVTDIVDSTGRWVRFEREMAADLARHDAEVRGVVESLGGSVFKHTGDGLMALFDDPVAAVHAAVRLPRVLGGVVWQASEPLLVRVAVNTGTVVERDGDAYGTAVNRAARLLMLCPPGGVVVGTSTAALLRDHFL